MDTENSGGQSESLTLTALEAVSPSEERDGKCSRRSLVREWELLVVLDILKW